MSNELLKWSIGHDPCRASDRRPLGPMAGGGTVSLQLRVAASVRHEVASASALVCEAPGSWKPQQLFACEQGFTGDIPIEDFPHVVLYAFRLVLADESEAYYVPRADGRATAGQLVFPGVDGEWTDDGWRYWGFYFTERPGEPFGLPDFQPGFQITVYDPAFSTPDWLGGAIMYQIFPDRFARGRDGVRNEGLAYHDEMKRPLHLHESWDDEVEWLGDPGDALESETSEAIGGPVVGQGDSGGEAGLTAGCDDSGVDVEEPPVLDEQAAQQAELKAAMKAYDPIDFFGGSLAGIREKLPYLESLGVEVLYLNPVFEARSNHRYDTADYERIEPLLGSNDDFALLARQAADHGISIVLDAVLSHTGDDSRYFNARATYDEPGAMQGAESPYYSWYDFTEQPNGVPYRCWWGDRTLPEVDECNAAWQGYVLGHPGQGDGVLAKWLSAGARGYRLDVADELPDAVLERIRASVKAAKPDAAIIGEVWEDPTTKSSYGSRREYALGRSLDTVMNYPLRSALIGFAIGAVDAQQLAAFLAQQQANYAPGFYRCLMNLLSSHDVERMRSALALGGAVKHLPRNEQVSLVAGITSEQDAFAARLQRMLVAFIYALPGAPCIYYGDERGLQGGGDPFCRATFPWSGERTDCGEDLTEFYRSIGELHKGSAVLRDGRLASMAPDADALCVVRVKSDGKVAFAVANRGMQDKKFAFDLHALGIEADGAEVPCVFCSEKVEVCDARVEEGVVTLRAPAAATAIYLS